MLTSAGVESSLPGLGLQPPWGPGLEELGAAHTCTRRPCRWRTRALRALIPLRRASRCSTEEIPRLIRSLQRRAGQSSQLTPTFCSPSLVWTGEGPESGQAGLPTWAAAGPLACLDSLGSHGGHGLQAPVAGCSEAVLVAAQVQGPQPRTHGAEGGEGGEGTVRQRGGRPRGRGAVVSGQQGSGAQTWSLS